MKRARGRPPHLDGFHVTKLKGTTFWRALGDAGHTMWPQMIFDRKTHEVTERFMLLERPAIAWITGRTERAVTGWTERKLLQPARYVGINPLFDIADVAHLVATGQFRKDGEPFCAEALAVKYFWTVPGFDKRPNKPGSVADQLDKEYRELLRQYPEYRKADAERLEFWRESA